MFSLIAAGKASHNFLASNKPKPVIAWTALITGILLAPTDFKNTDTSFGPSATTSSAAAATGAATAAADTPNSSSTA